MKSAEISWKFDFSDCGLAVKEFRIKGHCSDNKNIEWRVIGDKRVGCCPMLAGEKDIDVQGVHVCSMHKLTCIYLVHVHVHE